MQILRLASDFCSLARVCERQKMPTVAEALQPRQPGVEINVEKSQLLRNDWPKSMANLFNRKSLESNNGEQIRRKSQTFTVDTPDLEELRNKIANILLCDDLNFLLFIMQTNLPQINTSSVCQGLLDLLGRAGGNAAEEFTQRVVYEKFNHYVKENGTVGIKDVLRDNSAYVNMEAGSYVADTLTAPVQSLLTTLERCEVNPNDTSPESIAANEEHLQQACSVILASIVASYSYMPKSIRRLCRYIRSELDKACANINEPPKRRTLSEAKPRSRQSSRTSLSMSPNDITRQCRLSSVCPSPPENHTNFTSISNEQQSFIELINPIELQKPLDFNFVINDHHENSVNGIPARSISLMSPDYVNPTQPSMDDNHSSILSRDANSLPVLPNLLINTHVNNPSPTILLQDYSPSIDVLNDLSLTEEQNRTYDSPSEDLNVSLTRGRSPTRVSMSLHRNKAVSRRPNVKSPIYSTSEQILATFLFLRVYVPALTVPEAHNISTPGMMSKSQQRGLVLCGKVLVSVCGDNNMSSNASGRQSPSDIHQQFSAAFVREKQIFVKQFLASVCQDSNVSATPVTPLRSPYVRKELPVDIVFRTGQNDPSSPLTPRSSLVRHASQKLLISSPVSSPVSDQGDKSRFSSFAKFANRRPKSSYGLALEAKESGSPSDSKSVSRPSSPSLSMENVTTEVQHQIPSDELIAFLDKSMDRLFQQVSDMKMEDAARRQLLSAQVVSLRENIKKFADLSLLMQNARRRGVLSSLSIKIGLRP